MKPSSSALHLSGIRRVFAYVVLGIVAMVWAAPFLVLVLLSFKRRIEILTEVPPSLDFDWSVILANYSDVLFNRGFLDFGITSVIVTGAATLIALVVGAPAAYAFSRLEFRGRSQWATTVLSFRFMPPIAVAIPILLMMRTIGLFNTRLGLIVPYVAFSLPLVIWIMIGFFDEVPRELDDAARVDGCSRMQAMIRVVLPLVRPGLLVAGIFAAIFVWNEFLVGLYVISSQSLKTVPLGAAGLISAQRPIDWNVAATVGVVTILPLVLFSFYVQRHIVKGMTAGAVK